ncbi:lectin subunit alpha-like [Wyeomyia smithii]|uniref:lectin subunit alpha-like n=1 Tax=Wyeomyia smithii TaxID=174621 RepID=UPI0024681E78|nr:lectin subunit alpha-like [Wyeomyia smithii]
MKQVLLSVLLMSAAIRCLEHNLEAKGSIFVVPNTMGNWYHAGEHCNSIGMRLAVIDSGDKNDRAIEAIKKAGIFDTSNTKAWIGSSNLGTGEQYYWQSTGAKQTFWGPGEPNNNEGIENCAEIRYTQTSSNALQHRGPSPCICSYRDLPQSGIEYHTHFAATGGGRI